MFCPQCGLQNADDTKFCRSCGTDLSNLPAVVEGQSLAARKLSEKHINLFSSGIRGLIIGTGFLIASGAGFAISMRLAPMFLFFLVFSFYFLGTGISRLVQARALKSLNRPDANKSNPALLSGQYDYIKPSQSIYDTDDLIARPLSVTERTTTHLQMDTDADPPALPEK